MKGYTIENSIDLLEKDVKALKEGGGGGGGASTWNQLQGKPFNTLGEELYNLDGALTVNTISADKIALPDSEEYSWDYLSQAIEALAEDVNHFSDDISDLETTKADKLNIIEGITIIGTCLGKPLYQNVIRYTTQTNLTANAWTKTNIEAPDIDVFYGGYAITNNRATQNYNGMGIIDGMIAINSPRAVSLLSGFYIVLQYTKTSD